MDLEMTIRGSVEELTSVLEFIKDHDLSAVSSDLHNFNPPVTSGPFERMQHDDEMTKEELEMFITHSMTNGELEILNSFHTKDFNRLLGTEYKVWNSFPTGLKPWARSRIDGFMSDISNKARGFIFELGIGNPNGATSAEEFVENPPKFSYGELQDYLSYSPKQIGGILSSIGKVMKKSEYRELINPVIRESNYGTTEDGEFVPDNFYRLHDSWLRFMWDLRRHRDARKLSEQVVRP